MRKRAAIFAQGRPMKSLQQSAQRALFVGACAAVLSFTACGPNTYGPTGGTQGTGTSTGGVSDPNVGTTTNPIGNGNITAGNGNTVTNPNNPNALGNGNTTFNPNALKFAYYDAQLPTPPATQGMVALIVSANPNLCENGNFGPVQKGSADLSGIAACNGTDCTNVTMTVQVDTHPAAALPGECALYGDQADGAATVKGSAKLTGTTAALQLQGSVMNPNDPNGTVTFDYKLTPKMCKFPISSPANANDTVACQ